MSFTSAARRLAGTVQKEGTSVSQTTLGRRHRPDYQITLLMGLLLLIGLVVLFAISPYQVERINLEGGELDQAHFMQRQLLYLAAGLSAFTFAAFVPLKLWTANAGRALMVGLGACVLLSFLGIFIKDGIVYESGGAVRWFNLGVASFQPAELLKFGVMLFTAAFLGRRISQGKLNSVQDTLLPIFIVVAIASFLVIVLQKDMGTGITMLGIVTTMLFLAGLNKRLIFTSLALLVGAGLLLIVTSPHRIARVATFFNPSDTSDAANYHINQAAIAIGSGGFAGKGLGQGVQAFGYLPEALNDSIFAVLGETFGMVGLVVIMSIFAALILRMLRIFERMPDPTLRMLTAGVTGLIMTHAVVNIGAMTGIFPLTGVTLPFLSFGGTSLLFTMLALGIAFHISRYTSPQPITEKEGASGSENSLRGRGSGGHVTPVLAVINELSRLDPHAEVMFLCDKAFENQSRGLMKHAAIPVPVPVRTVTAGKLRRYHGVVWWKQLLDIPTVAKNIRDLFLVGVGIIQSAWILWRAKPDVMFAKGGYVCLPVGIAARVLGIPIVIHDSDTRPGLTNKVLGRWATAIATGAPLQNYNYPKEISHYTGVPIHADFHPFTEAEQVAAKEALGITDLRKPLVVVTGGGLGAKSINEAMLEIAPTILEHGAAIYHITGKGQYKSIEERAHRHADYILTPFVYKDMATVLGAADIVVARGSATFLQELAALQKAVIVIPAGHLSDQVKNAEVFESAEAALVLTDAIITSRSGKLAMAIKTLIDEPAEAHRIAAQLHMFAKPDAAADVAALIIDTYSSRVKKKVSGGIDGAIS